MVAVDDRAVVVTAVAVAIVVAAAVVVMAAVAAVNVVAAVAVVVVTAAAVSGVAVVNDAVAIAAIAAVTGAETVAVAATAGNQHFSDNLDAYYNTKAVVLRETAFVCGLPAHKQHNFDLIRSFNFYWSQSDVFSACSN